MTFKVDFAGINTYVYEPITSSANMLGYPVGTQTTGYMNSNIGLIYESGSLNALLLHRYGPYQHPMWKQLRTDNHPILRLQKQNSIISVLEPSRDELMGRTGVYSVNKAIRGGALKQFVEPYLTQKHKPVIHVFERREQFTNPKAKVPSPVSYPAFMYSHGNKLVSFANDELRLISGYKNCDRQTYDDLTELYLGENLYGDKNPLDKFKFLIYRERIFPKDEFEGLKETRERSEYVVKYWNNDRNLREKASRANSYGNISPSQSVWNTDAQNIYSSTPLYSPGQPTASGEGELLQRGVIYHHGTQSNKVSEGFSPMYACRMMFSASASNPANPGLFVYDGIPLYQLYDLSGKAPFPDNNFSGFNKDIRLKNKDYSLVPEFNLSDHIDYFILTKNGDFLSELTSSFSITGTILKDSSNANFVNRYMNTDVLSNYGKIFNDHSELVQSASLVLKCDAIAKFLPREGFFPQTRLAQIAALFSQSYSDSLIFGNGSTNRGKRAFYNLFFSPGIVFNTMKSQVAVDMPYFTASNNYAVTGTTYAFYDQTGGSTYRITTTQPEQYYMPCLSASFDFRLPFEAILAPENYLLGTIIRDSWGHHPSASLYNYRGGGTDDGDVALQGLPTDPRYKLAMHNFLAESVNLYLANSSLTAITSLPDDQENFGLVDPTKVYEMDVYLYSDYRFKAYSHGNAFGPPVSAMRSSYYGNSIFYNPYYSFAPYTPPYFLDAPYDNIQYIKNIVESFEVTAGEKVGAKVRLRFVPYKTNSYKYTADEIVSALTSSYSRLIEVRNSYNEIVELSDNTSIASKNAMQISASLNLKNVIRYQETEYDALTEQPSTVKQSAASVWQIQTKYETPGLNFMSHLLSGTTISIPDQISQGQLAYEIFPVYTYRGMWHQKGSLSKDGEGISILITDPKEYNTSLTSSLADLVGFQKSPAPIGRVAESRKITEAVVAIPYFDSGDSEFIKVGREHIDIALKKSQGETTQFVQNMVDKLKKYVLPPKFDFLSNRDIEPYLAFVFEYGVTFSKEELAELWQGIIPSKKLDFEMLNEEVEYDFSKNNFLDIKDAKNLKWLIFKLKKRAEKNYWKKVADSSADQRFQFDINFGSANKKTLVSEYSYNYPYDFCSIVEAAKIEAELKIGS